MQKLIYFIRKTSVAIVFIVLEIIAIRIYAYSTPYTEARLLMASNCVVGWIHSSFAGISNYFSLRKENISLTERIVELENQIATLSAQLPEAELEVSEVVRQYEYISARVTASTTNRSRNYITLDKGYAENIAADMAVMTPEGYAVGVVVECSEGVAIAKTLLNSDLRIGGMLEGDGSHGSIVWGGTDAQVVDFVELSKYAKVEVGDTVNVAGFSHFFPRGVRVGSIEKVELAENGTSYNCKVRLAADMGRLYNVVLVRNTRAGEARALEALEEN